MFISPLSETQVKVCTLSVNQCVLGREALSMFLQQTSDLTPLQTRRYTHTSLCVCVQAKQICTDVYLKRVSLHCQPVSEIRERADLVLMREEGKKGCTLRQSAGVSYGTSVKVQTDINAFDSVLMKKLHNLFDYFHCCCTVFSQTITSPH